MSTNHHTEIATGASANASTFNSPLGQLDQSIDDLQNGTLTFSKVKFDGASTLTISSGSVTPTQSLHLIAAETGTTDNLDTITAVNNSVLYIKADSGDTITLTNSGNLNADNIALTGNMIIGLFCHNSQWSIISNSLYDALSEDIAKLTSNLYIRGFELYVEQDAINVQPGVCMSDDNSYVFSSSSAIVIDRTASGALGLDTGSIGASTWYWVWLCAGASGVTAVFADEVTPAALVKPTGYDSYVRRIGAVRTDGSSQFYPSRMVGRGGFGERKVHYATGDNSTFRILNEADIGTSGAKTSVNCSALVPITATHVIALITINTPSAIVDVYWYGGNGNPTIDKFIMALPSTSFVTATVYELELNTGTATGSIYSTGTSDEDLSFTILGYIDSENWLGYTP